MRLGFDRKGKRLRPSVAANTCLALTSLKCSLNVGQMNENTDVETASILTDDRNFEVDFEVNLYAYFYF